MSGAESGAVRGGLRGGDGHAFQDALKKIRFPLYKGRECCYSKSSTTRQEREGFPPSAPLPLPPIQAEMGERVPRLDQPSTLLNNLCGLLCAARCARRQEAFGQVQAAIPVHASFALRAPVCEE
jgi:hypothetical protein